MKHHLMRILVFATVGAISVVPVGATDSVPADHPQIAQGMGGGMQRSDEMGFIQMLNERERSEFRERMRAAQSVEERERIRAEYRERVHQRTLERQKTMPDRPRLMPSEPGRQRRR